MEITQEYLYETIGRLVMYKELLERQVKTLQTSLVAQIKEKANEPSDMAVESDK